MRFFFVNLQTDFMKAFKKIINHIKLKLWHLKDKS